MSFKLYLKLKTERLEKNIKRLNKVEREMDELGLYEVCDNIQTLICELKDEFINDHNDLTEDQREYIYKI